MPSNAEIAIASTIAVVYNNAVNLLPRGLHRRLYVVLNLVTLLAVFAWAVQLSGVDQGSLGLQSGQISRGFVIGIAVSLIASIPFVMWITIPSVARLIRRHISAQPMGRDELAYNLLLRIPIGTALFEEMLFRGVLFTLVEIRWGTATAIWYTSVLFAAWHITPAANLLLRGFLAGHRAIALSATGSSNRRKAFIYSGQLGSVFIAGLGLAMIRVVGHSAVAPFLVHAAVNCLASFALTRETDRPSVPAVGTRIDL